MKVVCGVPIRRSRWPSFWVGVLTGAASSLIAAGLVALPLVLSPNINGVVLILAFAVVCFGLFFLSYPLQRRWARSLDSRRAGISFAAGILIVPVGEALRLRFDLNEPHELSFGWCEYTATGTGGPTGKTRTVLAHAVLAQGGRRVFLKAEDSIRPALNAGWPNLLPIATSPATPVVRLWVNDLVDLVDALKARASV